MTFLLGNPIFRCYVSFREGNASFLKDPWKFQHVFVGSLHLRVSEKYLCPQSTVVASSKLNTFDEKDVILSQVFFFFPHFFCNQKIPSKKNDVAK